MSIFSTSKTTIAPEDVLRALEHVIDPDLGRNVVSLGMIKDVVVKGPDVSFTFELTTPSCPLKAQLENEAREAVTKHIQNVGSVKVNMTARVTAQEGKKREYLPTVKNTIAVASGKGGVGKSTVAVNLALALARDGARVGLIDADIYGPSIPLMFGLQGQQPKIFQGETKKFIAPIKQYGVDVMSIGFLVDPDQAMIWRGPMASGALKQFMTDVAWDELDYLIFDLPPGTGDIQLTLVQTVPLTGAVIVTTPQDVSLADARKGLKMFQKVNVPVFGIIENMSYYVCSSCGHRDEIFSHGGGKDAAQELGVPFLGEIPLTTNIRVGGDKGTPIVALEPQSPAALTFVDVARKLAQQISIANAKAPSMPPIQIEFESVN